MTFKQEARIPSTVWTLVADRSRARIFAGEWPELADIREVLDFAHPEGATHQRDVEADGSGRFQEPGGPSHAGQPETDFPHRTAAEFARELVQHLQSGRGRNEFGRLIVIAPALFLGVLRESLPAPLARMVIADSDKDLTRQDKSAIQSEIRELLSTAVSGS